MSSSPGKRCLGSWLRDGVPERGKNGVARWSWLFRGAPEGAWGLSDDRAQAGLQTPPFPARHQGGGHSEPAGVTPYFCCSPTLSAVCPASVPHALSRRTCGLTGGPSPIRGRGVLVCSFRLLTDDGAELQVTLTSQHGTLPSSPSLSASSFSFFTSLSSRCSPKLPAHSCHPQTSASVRRSHQETEMDVLDKKLKKNRNCLG